MPIVTTDSYRIKAQHYRIRQRVWIAVLALTQVCYALWIWYLAVTTKDTKITEAGGGIGAFDVFMLLWWPIWGILYSRKMANRFSAEGFDLSIQTLEFTPALRGEKPSKITIAFQWPKEFDVQKDSSGNVVKPVLPVTPTNIKARLQTDISSDLSRLYERYSTHLKNPKEVYAYKVATVDTAIFKTLETLAKQMGLPYLKFDCTAIEAPKPEAPPEPSPTDRIFL